MSQYVKAAWERFFEPDHEKHPKLCMESREMFKQCVTNSICFQESENFKECATEKINAECVPYRIDFFRCKRFMVDRSKDFR